MKKGPFKKVAALSFVLIITVVIVLSMVQNPEAVVLPQSSNVICVPDRSCNNGGTLPNTNFPNGDTFVFTNVQPSAIADGDSANPLTGNDTVMLLTSDFSFQTYWADADFNSRITSFVQNGGKLIIYDSESTTSDFSGFIYPFTASAPGAYGASTPVVNLLDDTLSSDDPTSDRYVNMALLTSTDAGGDANTMVSYNSNWYIDMVANNTLGVFGPVHTYAFYGDGMIIYNGLDIDYASATQVGNATGSQVLGMIWYLELSGQDIGPGVSVSGLTLSPKTATNPVETMHTVTATVTDSLAQPVEGKAVNFSITSGPNTGLKGAGVSDAQGQVTFSWSSSTAGTDTVTASMEGVENQTITDTATKTWVVEATASKVALTPKIGANPVGASHTVTATVTDDQDNPVSGVTVNFTVTSGPSMGTSGTGVTDAQGEATFSWTSNVVGTDTVTATIMLATGQPTSDTATKDWIPGNQIPEVPLGTIAIAAFMLIGIGLFMARGRISKKLKTWSIRTL